jgi:hypothetical protein
MSLTVVEWIGGGVKAMTSQSGGHPRGWNGQRGATELEEGYRSGTLPEGGSQWAGTGEAYWRS